MGGQGRQFDTVPFYYGIPPLLEDGNTLVQSSMILIFPHQHYHTRKSAGERGAGMWPREEGWLYTVEGGSGSPTVFSKSVLTIRTAGNGFAH
jgi:hypothetical protein